jgi:Tol biopolymer transport system component
VFSSGADGDDEIYIMNINGANLQQLTRNLATKTNTATDYQPSFSPNGEKIVFVSDRQGNNKELIYDYQDRVIGVGSSKTGALDIYIMNSDGSDQMPLTYHGLNLNPFFSPDGEKIIFRSNRPLSLRIMDLNTLREGILKYGGGEAKFTQDGKKLLDNFKGNISLADISGSNMLRLTNFSNAPGGVNNKKDNIGIDFTLSSDGKKVAIATIEMVGWRPQIFKFYTINLDGSELENIYSLKTKGNGILWNFKYSPDRERIICNADFDEQGLYLLNLGDKSLINLTGEKENWDAFSNFPFTFIPNGKRIVFVANIYPKNYNLALFVYKIKVLARYLLLWRNTPPYDNKYLCTIDIDGKNYRRIVKLPAGSRVGHDFIHWE